ncbi:MAG: glycine dehydrogenase (aminomethyl-transferring) [Flavobacteriia bacterium]|nr:glycine dehydrogenase (aminomethyl-transferring) [Flavobacteriia bacterium]
MMAEFAGRHIGPQSKDLAHMLAAVGVDSVDELVNQTVPDAIRNETALDVAPAMSESDYLRHVYALSQKNQVFASYIGQGYHPAATPAVIQRNILENPGWYTAYTPYQAEIAQGRLEALLNFQTMVIDLTGMEIANASLLDEATAAAEAMSLLMAARSRDQQKRGANKFFVDRQVFAQTRGLLETRSTPMDIELVVGDMESFQPSPEFFGALCQYPNAVGQIEDIRGFIQTCQNAEIRVAVAADLLSLTLLTAPGDMMTAALKALGYTTLNTHVFDTVHVAADASLKAAVREATESAQINVGYTEQGILISTHEVMNTADAQSLVDALAAAKGAATVPFALGEMALPSALARQTAYMTHPVFSSYRSETEMMRYIKKLERRDIALNHSMIPLGSCTMKLNAAAEMLPLSWPAFGQIHPFAPLSQAAGFMEVIRSLERDLAVVTGFDATTLQPNSGAQGEYSGLLVIRAYHHSRGDYHRKTALIPSSAHGTNPASAVMAGMDVVVVACDEKGNIDLADLRAKAEQYSDTLSSLMITYPSTHGVFEAGVKEATAIIHAHGGQVYMDGANMNAQVGLTSPGNIGADVCHLNLHKTFAIPHGGGGPGVGPICVKAHLAPFLPSHPVHATSGEKGIGPVSAAPYGSALVLLISYGYIKMLGAKGLVDSTKYAILNANYIKSRLENAYPVLYSGENGRCAHEMILDCRPFKRDGGIEVTDIAKRLMDFGYHAPTVSFPVAGTVMIEPTESESLAELDRFCDAMLAIKAEIDQVIDGTLPKEDNPLKNAPHTLAMVANDEWTMPYSRQMAAFPLPELMENKFWPIVRRVDDAYGDRNLVCTCAPIEAYSA